MRNIVIRHRGYDADTGFGVLVFACCRYLGAWLGDSRCLRFRLRGLGFSVGGHRLRIRLICCARFLAASVVGKKITDDCRKEASDTNQDQGNYQGVSKEVSY